jgi:hypothetical protein
VRFSKWGGGRHWEFSGTVTASDRHGVWVYSPVGTELTRPGHDFTSEVDWMSLVPGEHPWAAAFYDSPGHGTSIYVDMCTVARWSGREVSMVDLDLDVILRADGNLILDDEDEFDEHRVALGYPDDVVRLARDSSREVLDAIALGVEPFLSAGHARLLQARADGATGTAS